MESTLVTLFRYIIDILTRGRVDCMHAGPDQQSENGVKRRGFAWVALMALVLLTLVIAIGLVYLVAMHNFPHAR